jgi:hypothetical protein
MAVRKLDSGSGGEIARKSRPDVPWNLDRGAAAPVLLAESDEDDTASDRTMKV